MSFERSYREQINSIRRIPLRYQRRYLANISNGSFNATFRTGLYKNKIKSILKNNQFLALALQNDRLKIEELLAESKANADLIMFSTLKLSSMSENLRKVVSALDETLSMFQRHSSKGLKKFTPKNTVHQEEFKEQLRDVFMEPIIEEIEPPQTCRDVLEDLTIQGGVTPTNKQVFPVPIITTPYTYEICDSLKSKVIEENLVTKKIKRKKLNEYEISKEMLVKNSPLKEVCADSESNKKKTLQKTLRGEAKKKTQIVSNKANQENNTSKVANTVSEYKELQINSKIRQKSLLKKPNLSKSIGINKFKKNKGKSVKHEDSKINEESKDDEFSKVLHKNKKRIFEKKACDDLIKGDTIAENKDILCSNSAYSAPKISSTPLEKILAHKPNEVNNDASKFKKFESCKNLNEGAKTSQVCKRPLKCLSSEMNIENLENKKVKQKSKTSKIDDLTLDMPVNVKDLSSFPNKRKSYKYQFITDTKSVITNNYAKDENTPPLLNMNIEKNCSLPKPNLNFDYHQGEEMVKNLASNTYLVTAEVHEQPDDSLSKNEMQHQKTNSIPSVHPVVRLTDIFETGKSFCKSISNPADVGKGRVPLEVQLLEHCSSLKLLTSEPLDVQNVSSLNTDSGLGSSVDQKDNEGNCKTSTTLLTSDVIEKRQFRKRPSQICYKEPSTNVKLRR